MNSSYGKVTDRRPRGKKTRCPQCGRLFVMDTMHCLECCSESATRDRATVARWRRNGGRLK